MLCSLFISLFILSSSLRTLELIDSTTNPFFIDVLETKSEEEIIIRISLKKSYLDVSSNDADLLNKISKITIYDGTSDIDVTFTPDNNNKLSFIDSTNTTLLLSINPTLITIKLQSITTTDSFYQLNAEILLVVKGNESLQTFPEIAIANSVNKVSKSKYSSYSNELKKENSVDSIGYQILFVVLPKVINDVNTI